MQSVCINKSDRLWSFFTITPKVFELNWNLLRSKKRTRKLTSKPELYVMSSFNGTCTEVAIQPSVFNGTSIEVADSTPPMCYGQCLALPSLRTLYWYRIAKLIHNEAGFLFPSEPSLLYLPHYFCQIFGWSWSFYVKFWEWNTRFLQMIWPQNLKPHNPSYISGYSGIFFSWAPLAAIEPPWDVTSHAADGNKVLWVQKLFEVTFIFYILM